jgi:hypothetical protein
MVAPMYAAMTPVSSSAIAAVGYDNGVLAVLFHTSPTLYLHRGVPYSLYVGLMNASSMGAYYNAFIRGKFR